MFAIVTLALLLAGLGTAGAAELAIVDAHIHYSHDAWDATPPKEAVAILRKAGLKKALVSSSPNEGTQKLMAEAPDLIVPGLRPYRKRGELSTWMKDPEALRYVEEQLPKLRWVSIGEFHINGAEVDLPIPRRIVELAKQHGLFLQAHSDADAVERIFKQDGGARVLWAHAGFASVEKVREMMRKHKGLWADLALRSEVGSGGRVNPEWRAVFTEFPDRFMVGTDTWTPSRWHDIVSHAAFSRAWLADLPADLAERIAWKNAESLFVTAARR
jgi:predicted TIM-barrel fold metal-dependent hydrolase